MADLRAIRNDQSTSNQFELDPDDFHTFEDEVRRSYGYWSQLYTLNLVESKRSLKYKFRIAVNGFYTFIGNKHLNPPQTVHWETRYLIGSYLNYIFDDYPFAKSRFHIDGIFADVAGRTHGSRGGVYTRTVVRC